MLCLKINSVSFREVKSILPGKFKEIQNDGLKKNRISGMMPDELLRNIIPYNIKSDTFTLSFHSTEKKMI